MTIALRSSATSSGETITGPSDIAPGDLLVLYDRARGSSGPPTLVTPTGFTSETDLLNGFIRTNLSWKLADGSEASATITGMNPSLEGGKCLLVFSGNISAVTPSTFNEEITNGNPSSQSVLAGTSGTAPLVVVGGYSANSGPGVDPRTFSPAKDGEINPAGVDFVYLAYKIYNSSPADVSIDMDDEGGNNALQSGYFELTESGVAIPIFHQHYEGMRRR